MTQIYHNMPNYYSDGKVTIYNCDNLVLLRSLGSGSINLIYCDVLYNSGKKFDYYEDDLGTPKDAIKWYRPRFEEMKRVLANNGSIYIHCNWRLDSYLRILMDEIFGFKCYRNKIVRKHSEERGFYRNYDSQHDSILYYVNNPEDFTFNETQSKISPVPVPLFENGENPDRSDIRWFKGKAIDLAAINKHWLISPIEYYRMVENNEVRLMDGLPFRYTSVKPIGNIWAEPEMLDEYSRTINSQAFDTPKPLSILRRIIATSSNPGDTVADFFMGAGSTAVVAKEMNRNGIFCDINPDTCELAVNRIKKMKTE